MLDSNKVGIMPLPAFILASILKTYPIGLLSAESIAPIAPQKSQSSSSVLTALPIT